MGICKINAGISLPANCLDNALVAGVRDEIILVNIDDISGFVFDAGNPLLITAVTRVSTTLGYGFEGQLNSNEPSYELVKQGFNRVYDHILTFKGFDVSAASKLNFSQMVKAKVVAFIENNDKTFEVYGADTGLLVDTLVRNPNDSDTGGAFDVTLRSDENIKEPKMPLTWLDTDYATTKALFDGLKLAAA